MTSAPLNAWGRHADDGVIEAIDFDLLADHNWGSSEARLPATVGNDGHGMTAAVDVIGWGQQAAPDGLNARSIGESRIRDAPGSEMKTVAHLDADLARVIVVRPGERAFESGEELVIEKVHRGSAHGPPFEILADRQVERGVLRQV